MSTTRGTKRSAESTHSGPKFKSAKSAPQKSNFKGKSDNKPKWDHKAKPSNFKGKDKAKEVDQPVQKRKRPVTQGGGEEDDAMSVDEQDDEFDGEEGGEGAGETQEKKGKMSKAERAALHAAQPHRTSLLPSHPLLHDTLLPLWETARRSDTPKDERNAAIKELWEAVKGRVAEISRGHKGGRVLQTIVKYGGKEERLGVALELESQWRDMMESKYSKFLMSKLIRYCPTIRPKLIPHITKNITSLIFHAHAISPISDFYDLYASPKERRLLVRGFYPREVALFDGAGKDAEKDVAGLEAALEATSESGRERVIDGVEKTVLDIFNNTQKTALAQSIFHRLVFEYLASIYRFLDAEVADKKMHELLAASLESLPEIVHTKDGSAVVRELLVRGNAKDRKSILQQLRKHIEAMSKDADAQLVLFTAFDVVDDTKLMGKAFVGDIVEQASTLTQDKNGRRAILYALTPTASRHYLPSTLKDLAASATAAREAGTSKKDPAVRRKELVVHASPGLLKLVADKAEELVRDPGAGLVVQEIMIYTQGDKGEAIAALVEPLRVPLTGDGSHPIELAHATRTYKTLLSGGHFNMSTKTIDVVDDKLSPTFAEAYWRAITSDDAGGATNAIKVAAAAPFVAVEMIEALKKTPVWNDAKAVLTGADARAAIASSEMKGANVLSERLAAL
ncbi:Pumilio y domain member 6 [Vanrija albida]|uniref:Pumilio y domain member 6 n=1 Tax=Vanrija albida TaxID=181172 RepID=A0ABR3Q969_9TREE